jgi:hypothetical protein
LVEGTSAKVRVQAVGVAVGVVGVPGVEVAGAVEVATDVAGAVEVAGGVVAVKVAVEVGGSDVGVALAVGALVTMLRHHPPSILPRSRP